jgi:hypothetical protein
LGVGTTTVKQLTKLKAEAPDLFEKVVSGVLVLPTAMKQLAARQAEEAEGKTTTNDTTEGDKSMAATGAGGGTRNGWVQSMGAIVRSGRPSHFGSLMRRIHVSLTCPDS